ncbi:universal ribosomal protein uS10 family protein [Abortiporus biennis]
MLVQRCRNVLSSAQRWARFYPAVNTSQNGSSSQGIPPTAPNSTSEFPIFTAKEIESKQYDGRCVTKPYSHPKTHGIPVADLHIRSHHKSLLDLFTHFSTHVASALAIPISGTVNLPTQRSLWTVNASPFIYKSAQENFERLTHKRVIKAFDADPDVVDKWFKYLQAHLAGGVGLRMVKWDRAPVGIGKEKFLQVKGALRGPQQKAVTSGEKIKKLGKKIIKEESAAAVSSATAEAAGAQTVVVQQSTAKKSS